MKIFKRAALGLAIVLVVTGMNGAGAGAASSESSRDSGRHWPRSSGQQTLVVVQVEPSAEVLRPAITAAAAKWNTNPRVAVVVRACRAGENCLPFRGAVRNGGQAPQAFVGAHLVTSPYTYVVFDNRRGQNLAALSNGICHEMGHGLGLSHGAVDGPCQNARPTTFDQNLVTRMYTNRDTTGPAGV